jgi:MFS family permease
MFCSGFLGSLAPRVTTALDRTTKARAILRVASGNLLEMYDFMIYGYYAPQIAGAFFPSKSALASLLLSLATFGAGFLMRPVGALVLGAYIDRHGRRRGLLLTLGLMSIGTVSIACTPPFAVIGLAAPVLVVLGRLLQGLSAGVELGGVSVYLAEIATPGHRGFYVSWQSASQQVAVVAAAALGVLVTRSLSPEQMEAWGFRVPMGFGCLIVPFLFVIRRSLTETDAFLARKRHLDARAIGRQLLAHAPLVATGALLATMTTVSFYVITAYTPTFGSQVLKLATKGNLLVTLAVGLSNLTWLPIMGSLSDRVGRRPLLVTFTILTIATAYPIMAWLTDAPSFGRLLAALLWLSFMYASYNGAMVVYLIEIMPPDVRTSGFALAYSLATALMGGFTPLVCTLLIAKTGDRAMPGAWLTLAAALGLFAAVVAPRVADGDGRSPDQ